MKYIKTEKERKLYLNQLKENQKEVLEMYHKEEKNSVLQNQIFGQSDEWEFIDIKVNANYHDENQREADKLYCMCGRPLKYQYILLDRLENKTLKLGIKHFEEHADIPHNIANQIKDKKYQLDEWLDDILLTIKKHKQNMGVKIRYQQVIDEFVVKTNNAPSEKRMPFNEGVITEKDLKLFHAFKNVDLPLPTKLYKKVEQVLQSYEEKQRAEERGKELWAKIKGSKHLYKPQKSKRSEQREAIADCRRAMDKLFNRGKEIPFNRLYIEEREAMEKLFKEFDKETVIQRIADSINLHSNNNVSIDWEEKVFIKTGEKM